MDEFGILIIAGFVALILGLIGKIKSQWLDVGTNNIFIRVAFGTIGISFILWAFSISSPIHNQNVKKTKQIESKEVKKTDTIQDNPAEVKKYCQFVNRSSGKYLEVDRCREDDNAPILQLNYRNDNKCQLFVLIPIGTLFQIKNAKIMRSQCLDVHECRKEDGVIVKQFTCREANDANVRCQEFDLIKVRNPNQAGTPIQIKSLISGKCLDIAGCGNNYDEVQIKQCECRGNDDSLQVTQLFDLIEVQK